MAVLVAPAPLQIPLDNAVTRHEYPKMTLTREHLQRCMSWLHAIFANPLVVNFNSVAHARLAHVLGNENVGVQGTEPERSFFLHLFDEKRTASVCVVLHNRHLLEFLTNLHGELMSEVLARSVSGDTTRSWLDGMSRVLRMCAGMPPPRPPPGANHEPLPETLDEFALFPFYGLRSAAAAPSATVATVLSPAVRLLASRMYATSIVLGVRDLCPVYIEGIKEAFCQVACGGHTDFPPKEKDGHQTLSWFASASGPLFEIIASRASAVRRVFDSTETGIGDLAKIIAQCNMTHTREEKDKKIARVSLVNCVLSALAMEAEAKTVLEAASKRRTDVTTVLNGYAMSLAYLFGLLTRDLQFHSIKLLYSFSAKHNHRVFPVFFYHRCALVPVIRRSMNAYLQSVRGGGDGRQYLLLRTRDRSDDLPVTVLVCTEAALPPPANAGARALVAEVDPLFLPGSVRACPTIARLSTPASIAEWTDILDETQPVSTFEYGIPRVPPPVKHETPRPATPTGLAIKGIPMWEHLPGDTSALSVQLSTTRVPQLAPPPPPPRPPSSRHIALHTLQNLAPRNTPF